MIADVVTFNGEYDLFEIRYNMLKDVVDEFIVVEAPTTFSGQPKPLYFEKIKDKYPDVKYFVIDENYTQEEITLAKNSPNTVGADHWQREFLQKESIKKALTHLKDKDVCFIGDVDEIWYHELANAKPKTKAVKLKLDVYTYWLNNRSSEEFWGTIVARYDVIKMSCLNHLRTNSQKTDEVLGWHFTSLGGYEEVKRKLSDSYTRDSYWTERVETELESNIKNNKDFLGRGFTYHISETNLPKYILDNKQKYVHLFK